METGNTEGKNEPLHRCPRRPTTPGEMVAQLLEEQGISQTCLARRLGVSRASVNNLISGRRALTPDMAARLGVFFGDGGTVWLRMQQAVEMWDFLYQPPSIEGEVEPWAASEHR